MGLGQIQIVASSLMVVIHDAEALMAEEYVRSEVRKSVSCRLYGVVQHVAIEHLFSFRMRTNAQKSRIVKNRVTGAR